MKLVYTLLLLLTVGCGTPGIQKMEINETNTETDSIIIQSRENLVLFDETSRKSDSSITEKVEKAVQKINTLEAEVKHLKTENNVLKVKVNDADDTGQPFELLPVSGGKNDR